MPYYCICSYHPNNFTVIKLVITDIGISTKNILFIGCSSIHFKNLIIFSPILSSYCLFKHFVELIAKKISDIVHPYSFDIFSFNVSLGFLVPFSSIDKYSFLIDKIFATCSCVKFLFFLNSCNVFLFFLHLLNNLLNTLY